MSKTLSETAPLVLGSGSPRRRELLANARVSHEIVVAAVDESVHVGEGADAYLARIVAAKLEAVRAAIPRELAQRAPALLVADTSVILDGAILGKPAGVADAEAMIALLSGRTHEVHTRFAIARLTGGARAATVAARGETHAETVVTRVTFRALTPREVRAYAASGEGLDKAGAYAVQGLGASLVPRIDGSYANVVGLPVCEVMMALGALGLLSA
jgi:septum formation protein